MRIYASLVMMLLHLLLVGIFKQMHVFVNKKVLQKGVKKVSTFNTQ